MQLYACLEDLPSKPQGSVCLELSRFGSQRRVEPDKPIFCFHGTWGYISGCGFASLAIRFVSVGAQWQIDVVDEAIL